MLNRTNRTLSANQNRLNLAARSLAQAPGVNMGPNSLRIRLDHPQVVAKPAPAGTVEVMKRSHFMVGTYPMISIPGPSLPIRWLTTHCEPRTGAEAIAEAPPVLRPVVDDDRPQRPRTQDRTCSGPVRTSGLTARRPARDASCVAAGG
jgi:hypothetical protein